MRIISGTHKGRRINAPKNIVVRPTTDIAKEALFNILVNRIDFESISVLDLYAGLGGISLEFASRGCREVAAVDINHKCCAFIRQTALNFGMENVKVTNASAFGFLKTNKKSFDLIFADPPYDLKGIEELPSRVFESSSLSADGLLIVEHSIAIKFNDADRLFEHRNYGKVNFSFFR